MHDNIGLRPRPPAAARRLSRRAFFHRASWLAGAAVWAPNAGWAAGRTIFVAPDGLPDGPGGRETPFSTISAALAKTPGLGAADTIVALPGVYREQVIIAAGGDASGVFTLKSLVPHGAKIRSPKGTYSAVAIVANYVCVEGFDVEAGGDGHGIEATFLEGDSTRDGPHHIRIAGNVSHDNAGSGISLSYGDYYLIEDNVCYGNCATNAYQGSGISVYAPRAVDGEDAPHRIIIRRNVSHDNMAIKLPDGPPHSDGNGIIYDDSRNSQLRHPAGPYKWSALIENNLCYRNGGRGVHVFLSEHVLVRNNTCCYNNRDNLNPATWRGELSNLASSDCIWVNNIGVADLVVNRFNTAIMEGSTPDFRVADVIWSRNLTYDGASRAPSVNQSPSRDFLKTFPDHIFGIDPGFVRAGPSSDDPDFNLTAQSPAIAAGSSQFGVPADDLVRAPRVAGRISLGALQAAKS